MRDSVHSFWVFLSGCAHSWYRIHQAKICISEKVYYWLRRGRSIRVCVQNYFWPELLLGRHDGQAEHEKMRYPQLWCLIVKDPIFPSGFAINHDIELPFIIIRLFECYWWAKTIRYMIIYKVRPRNDIKPKTTFLIWLKVKNTLNRRKCWCPMEVVGTFQFHSCSIGMPTSSMRIVNSKSIKIYKVFT